MDAVDRAAPVAVRPAGDSRSVASRSRMATVLPAAVSASRLAALAIEADSEAVAVAPADAAVRAVAVAASMADAAADSMHAAARADGAALVAAAGADLVPVSRRSKTRRSRSTIRDGER